MSYDLPLFAQKDQDKAARLLDRMLDILNDGRWYKGAELQRLLHTNERVVRRIADLSAGRILGSDKGYRLLRHATLTEINDAIRRLKSQARKMDERAYQYERAKHQRGAAA